MYHRNFMVVYFHFPFMIFLLFLLSIFTVTCIINLQIQYFTALNSKIIFKILKQEKQCFIFTHIFIISSAVHSFAQIQNYHLIIIFLVLDTSFNISCHTSLLVKTFLGFLYLKTVVILPLLSSYFCCVQNSNWRDFFFQYFKAVIPLSSDFHYV